MRIHPVPREAGRLYAAVLNAGFSIGGFARRMGNDRSTLWRIDRGLQQPDDGFYARAAQILNVPVEEIAPREAVGEAAA